MSETEYLAGRMKHLLATGRGADVHFFVGEGDQRELISAHKLILRTASEVFDAMFPLDPEKGKAEDAWEVIGVISSVEVTDVEVGAFKVMLDFIYAEDLNGLSGTNALAVLFAAKKYRINELIEPCVGISIWQLPNVFFALAYARSLEENDFANRCLKFIDQHAYILLQSDEFLQIDHDFLCEILDHDQLRTCGEIAIWNAALRWADAQCGRKGVDCSAENRRAALGPALFKIRFPLIPQKEFSETIVPSDVLTKDEMLSVMLFHSRPNPDTVLERFPLLFPIQRRNFVRSGTIAWKIEKFSEFVRANADTSRKCTIQRSSDLVNIMGITWRISALFIPINKLKVSFSISCDRLKKEHPMNGRLCSASFRIVSQKEGKADYVEKAQNLSGNIAPYFSIRLAYIALEELIDPANGWYDEENDSMNLVVELFVDEHCEENAEKRGNAADQQSK